MVSQIFQISLLFYFYFLLSVLVTLAQLQNLVLMDEMFLLERKFMICSIELDDKAITRLFGVLIPQYDSAKKVGYTLLWK